MISMLLWMGCAPSHGPAATVDAPSAHPDRFHLADGFLRDARGRAVVLFGVNVSNSAKDPSTGFYGWHSRADMQALADWGFDSVRLLTFWEAIEPEEGVIDEAYLDGLEERVDWATEAGLGVVLDMHQDVYGRGFGHNAAPIWTCDQDVYDAFVAPTGSWALAYLTEEVRTCFDRFWASEALQSHYGDAWVAVAERFADDPGVIGFDLMNEPWPASGDAEAFGSTTLQDFYVTLAHRLAEAAPGKLVFVEPITLTQYGTIEPGLAAIEGAETIFAPHYYEPAVHEGEPYDGDAAPIDVGFAWFDAAAADMQTTWWLGEWGGPPGDEGIAGYLADVDARLASRAVGAALWSYDESGGFAILDGEGALREDIDVALMHPRVRVYGGDPGGARWSDGALRFTVLPREGVAAESEVWVGEGAVTVDGAEDWELSRGLLRVTGVGEITVRLD